MEKATVTRLSEVRTRVRAEVLSRYNELKGKGRVEEEARNVAVAWTAMRTPYTRDVIRRELDAALKPRPVRGSRPDVLKPEHWRLPT